MIRELLRPTALFLSLACAVFAQQDIRDQPGGKRLLFVDSDDIRPEPGGTRLLFVDGSDIRPEPGGKRLLFVDGDDVRPEPGGIRYAFFDGDQLRRRPGGKVLLSVKHPEIRTDLDGSLLYFVDGAELSRAQMVAVLYQLKPEVFKLTDEETAELKKEFAENAAAAEAEASKDRIVGTFDLVSYYSPSDAPKRSGAFDVVKKGDFYLGTSKFKDLPEQVGVIQKIDDEFAAMALGPAGTVALGSFDIKGNTITGSWIPAAAPGGDAAGIGTETMTGGAELKGEFKVVGKSPKTQADYAGTVTITPEEANLEGNSTTYSFVYTFGSTKVTAIGFRYKDKLYLASGSAKGFEALILRTKDGLIGDYFNEAKEKGSYTMIHKM